MHDRNQYQLSTIESTERSMNTSLFFARYEMHSWSKSVDWLLYLFISEHVDNDIRFKFCTTHALGLSIGFSFISNDGIVKPLAVVF
jgi:hypothetical protein